jgi:hypothetical protein
MICSAVLVIFTGIGEASPRHTGLASHHIAAASLFFIAVCMHGWYNRKAMVKYFNGFGWRWAVIAGCLIGVLIAGNLLA